MSMTAEDQVILSGILSFLKRSTGINKKKTWNPFSCLSKPCWKMKMHISWILNTFIFGQMWQDIERIIMEPPLQPGAQEVKGNSGSEPQSYLAHPHQYSSLYSPFGGDQQVPQYPPPQQHSYDYASYYYTSDTSPPSTPEQCPTNYFSPSPTNHNYYFPPSRLLTPPSSPHLQYAPSGGPRQPVLPSSLPHPPPPLPYPAPAANVKRRRNWTR